MSLWGKVLDCLSLRGRQLALGPRGELAAERYLRRQGLIIVGRGERDRTGEIDLIAVDRKTRTVVFVEVKTRQSDAAGHPAEAVDDRKQQRLTRLALAYLKRHDLLECRYRFDVVSIVWPTDAVKPTIQHFPSAFEPTDVGQMFS